MSAPAVYVIHENNEWVEPLRLAFEAQGIPFVEWFIDGGTIDLSGRPPEGVFYNRMSASSHTRAHRYAVELTGPLLAWLQHHGCRVVNGRRALQLEVSKFEQYLALHAAGVRTPATQEYIRPAQGSITRMEFIGGAFYYQVDVDTSGGFELCPADACEVGEQFCPAPGQDEKKKFQLAAREPDPDLVASLERFLRANDAEVAAAEYVENADGERFVYDINMNTNYNQQAEREAGNDRRAMHRVAQFLGGELARRYPSAQAS